MKPVQILEVSHQTRRKYHLVGFGREAVHKSNIYSIVIRKLVQGFETRQDKNQSAHQQKQARGLRFRTYK